MTYNAFINHMIKRHEGRSPKFYMRMNLAENEELTQFEMKKRKKRL